MSELNSTNFVKLKEYRDNNKKIYSKDSYAPDNVGVWTSIYCDSYGVTDDNVFYNTKTRLGNELTIRLADGGTSMFVVKGGNDIRAFRQYISYNGKTTSTYRLGSIGVNSGTQYYRWTGGYLNGSALNLTETNSGSAGNATYDGVTFHWDNVTSNMGGYHYGIEITGIKIDILNNVWSLVFTAGVNGAKSFCVCQMQAWGSTNGTVPSIFVRDANKSKMNAFYNYLEVLELNPLSKLNSPLY